MAFGVLLSATACGGVAGRDGGDTGGRDAGGDDSGGGTGGVDATGGAGGSDSGGSGGTGGAPSGCPSGEFSETGLGGACAEWTVCPSGTHVSTAPDATTDRECSACAEGTQTLGENESVCHPIGACPAGTVETTPGTATTEPVCAPCAPGEHCPGGDATAEPCASGTWDDDGNAATACVPQTLCVPGQFVGVDGTATSDRSCAECVDGYSTTDNAESCIALTDCLPGEFVDEVSTPTNDRVCGSCASGTFSSTMNASICAQWTECGGAPDVAGTSTWDAVCELKAIQVAAGGSHTCALLSDGTARCWGNNGSGQIGDGTSGNDRLSPVAVSGLSGVVALAAGASHTCALLSDGTARCWGSNGSGELGDGTSGTTRAMPAPVTDLNSAVALAARPAGGSHTCALLSDGTARCWGWNPYGQVGDGMGGADVTTPLAVSGLDGAVAIEVGLAHSCALLSNGTAECWGANGSGQLGDGTSTDRTARTAVVGLSEAVALSAGSEHTCALGSDGVARCWGRYGAFEIGGLAPVGIGGPSGLIGLSAGAGHTCALASDGTVFCWGGNDHGQLGGSTNGAYREAPVEVDGLSSAVALSAGGGHTCAILTDGAVNCWGQNDSGQLGDGTWADRPMLVAVDGLGGATAVSSGAHHTCAILADGTAWCWGQSASGQIGDGTYQPNRFVPVPVSGLSGVTALSAGAHHTCALLTDGTGRCWGRNLEGQVGGAQASFVPVPSAVSSLSGAIALSSGDSHTCALIANGTAVCWGANYDGQLGDGTSTNRPTPVAVGGLSGAVALAAGHHHTCALLSDGTARCWGGNSYGQVGDGTSTTRRTPVEVTGLSGAVALSAGERHTCALLSDGTADCWGANYYRQLGSGSGTYFTPLPAAVVGLSEAAVLSAGHGHTCVLLADETARCWGDNGYGQVGDKFVRAVLLP